MREQKPSVLTALSAGFLATFTAAAGFGCASKVAELGWAWAMITLRWYLEEGEEEVRLAKSSFAFSIMVILSNDIWIQICSNLMQLYEQLENILLEEMP